MNLENLKKELNRLIEVEEKLLAFLIYYPEHSHEVVKQIFEVCSLIVRTKNLIENGADDCDSDD